MDEFGAVGVDGGECEQLGEAAEGCHDVAEASGLHAVRVSFISFILFLVVFFFREGGGEGGGGLACLGVCATVSFSHVESYFA